VFHISFFYGKIITINIRVFVDKSSSFTLIELMTVVAIVAILSGITLIGFNLFLKQGKIAKSMAFDSSIHFNLGYAIKGDWKMNDNAANSTVVDTSGNNNDGTFLSGGSADNTANHSVDGANGTALEFDGVDDYINCGNNESLNPGSSDFTLAVWGKFVTDNGRNEIFYKGDPTNNQDTTNANGYRLAYFNNNIVFTFRDGENTYSEGGCNSPSFDWENKWHYILVTVDRDDSIKLYVDGELKITETITTPVGDINTTDVLTLGDHSWRTIDGSIDQVRIYQAAFSTSQVKYQYYTGLQSLCQRNLIDQEQCQTKLAEAKQQLLTLQK